jgi:UPF0755 protein
MLESNNTRRREAGRVRFAFVALLLLVGGLAWYFYSDYRHFAETPLAPLPESATIDVPLGTPLAGVVRLLEQRGIHTGNPWYWRALAHELGVAGKLHAGEFALTPGLSPAGLLRRMAAGDVVQHHFTIVEGWTFKQLRTALAQDDGLLQTLPALDDKDIMARLGAHGQPAEGWFLPETYSYVKGMTDFDVLKRAHEAMQKLLERLWAGHPASFVLDSPYQLLTLASIIEKETAQPNERPQIAAVFLHRLRIGMRLQTDPAVVYGLGASYDGKIHRRDLDADTPYNTYTRVGLPPTPIALPGKASLESVMHPAETEALYFVARGDGTHEFSATLEAHNRAVARYQLHQTQ